MPGKAVNLLSENAQFTSFVFLIRFIRTSFRFDAMTTAYHLSHAILAEKSMNSIFDLLSVNIHNPKGMKTIA